MKIIAEFCQNHNGNINVLDKMIAEASKHADILKIQTIKADTFTKRSEYELYRPYKPEYDRLKSLELSMNDERHFIQRCNEFGVQSMTTVFTPDHYEYFNELGYDNLKLSGYSLKSFGYGKKLNKFNFKKLYFSTSSLTLNEIDTTIKNLRMNNIDFEMMHCICSYPTTLDKAMLPNIQFYKDFFNLGGVGYSDHSNPHEDDLLITKQAIFSGISVLERHFTILGKDDTRDGKVSITPDMLAELRRFSKLNKVEQYYELNEFDETQKFNHKYYRGRFV